MASTDSGGCVTCHKAGNTVEPIGKGPGHPATSDLCQQCHQAGGSFTAGFNHASLVITSGVATPSCSTCHDGVTATGKTPNHVPTTRDCLTCHAGYPPAVASFAGGTFSHSGPEMTGKLCMSCHDGVIATGKKATHVATNQDCGACHLTTSFVPATSFNHTGVTSGCQKSGCHTSGNPSVVDVTDDKNPLPHIPIVKSGAELDCYSCHKNAGGTFANATMDHTVVTFDHRGHGASDKPDDPAAYSFARLGAEAADLDVIAHGALHVALELGLLRGARGELLACERLADVSDEVEKSSYGRPLVKA